MGPTGLESAKGCRIVKIHYASVGSTNATALDLAHARQCLPFLVTASEQTAGRGRSGQAWASPPGNFYGTFALPADKPDSRMGQVSFVAAVALAQVLGDWGLDPQLKWPNDVLIASAKISGILLEKHGPVLLVGVGVNVASHPELPDRTTTSLRALGLTRSPAEMGEALAAALEDTLALWQRDGFAPIQRAWLALAQGLNQPLRVRRAGRGDVIGLFRGLGPEGSLQLERPEGPLSIHAGEVFFHAAGH